MPVVPINDVKSYQPATYQKGERLVRCKLASVYRLVDIFGWNRGISNHITVRLTVCHFEQPIHNLLLYQLVYSFTKQMIYKSRIRDSH